MASAVPRTLSLDDARSAAGEAASLLNAPANVERLSTLRGQAGGNIMQAMALAVPAALEIVSPVLAKHGFESNQPGLMSFLFAINMHGQDPVIQQHRAQLMAQFMPGMPVPMAVPPQ
eukprot:TRINITY_DN6065_c0_g1_i1.p1 TRINITY_DN6065_c0_g1~~TRINITY_DN6065_c0_g1_i1.p1  ORF type:complete len:130 (+),score=27.11 TRINITY_DN6065_c0_g1_i1:41-391(+)